MKSGRIIKGTEKKIGDIQQARILIDGNPLIAAKTEEQEKQNNAY